ncbi:MAG: methyltransferase domain-containing protein [Clostridia bacterium]|nr:methyltransferase domain-containing protein [Clostridia bacterium]
MNKIEEYYNKTETDIPHKIVKEFIEMKITPGEAIDLGCGAGRDTIYLIKNGWKVTAIDREDTEERIIKRLNIDEKNNFKFEIQEFEKLKINKTNLIVANFSLPFCNKNEFNNLFDKIKKSILLNGYFVGNLFGIDDEWNGKKENIVFLDKEQILNLFKNFEIIKFEEIKENKKTGLGQIKYWHYFNIIAQKRRK